MPDAILVIGTLDSKGPECAFLRSALHDVGATTLLTMDVGVFGQPDAPAEISRDEVARAGGSTIAELQSRADRQHALHVMGEGAGALVRELFASGRLAGAIGIGGSGGTSLAAKAMLGLPVGFPRLIVSTVANLDMRPYVGFQDIVMLPSVADLAGLNRISRHTLRLGAAAIAGMVKFGVENEAVSSRPTVAITAIGLTTSAANVAREYLERAGCEVVIFHATGMGGDAMERLVSEGQIDGVLDMTLVELSDRHFGGAGPASAQRPNLDSGRNVPRVLVPGGLDMIKFGPADTVPHRFKDRTVHRHSDQVTLVRVDPAQASELGTLIAESVAKVTDRFQVLVPLLGLSAIDRPGQPFNSPEANEALFESLRKAKAAGAVVDEFNFHINDPLFAEAAAERLLAMMGIGATNKTANLENAR